MPRITNCGANTTVSGLKHHFGTISRVSKRELFAVYRGSHGTIVVTITYSVKLPSAVTLGGAYDEGGATPVDQQGNVIRCSER